MRPTSSVAGDNIPGAPLIFGPASSAPGNGPTGLNGFPAGSVPTPPTFANQFQQQQQLQQLLAAAAAQGSGAVTGSFGGGLPQAPISPNNFAANPAGAQQFLSTRQQPQQQQQSQFNPAFQAFLSQSQTNNILSQNPAGGNNFPIVNGLNNNNNGNCQRYFPKRGDGEWLPNTLMPLSFDRASETKVSQKTSFY